MTARDAHHARERALPIDRRATPGVWICAALAALCYVNTLGNGFCYDDQAIIVQNPHVTAPGYWGRLWLDDYWNAAAQATPHRDLLYRPVAVLSYRLNHLVGGLDPAGYHLVNLVLHVLVTVGVCRLARRLTGHAAGGLMAGALFAVLPIHTEAVANVVGRAELLAALFTLAAIELLRMHTNPLRAAGFSPRIRRNAVQAPPSGSRVRQRGVTLLGAVCAFLACCSKESGTVVLLLVPLINAFERRRIVSAEAPGTSAGVHDFGVSWRWRYLGLAIAAVAYLLLRYVALGGQLHQPATPTRTVNVLVDATIWPRICGALQLWGLYWLKTVWPQVLCITYSIQAVGPAYTPFEGPALLGLAVLLALAGWSIFNWRRGLRLPAVLTAALLISYLPMSNTVVLIKVYLAERAWYLPSIWIAIMAGVLLGGMWSRPSDRPAAPRWPGPVAMAIVLLLVAGGLARSWARNAEWRDEGTLYAAAYRDHPDAIVALVQYGQWLASAGRHAEGNALLSRATQMEPGFTDAQRLLGAAYLAAGMPDRAFDHLQTADVQIPGHPWTQRLLARAQSARSASRADRVAQAEQFARDHPDELEAWTKLADELIGAGQAQRAVDRLLQIEDRFAANGAFHRRLADALLMANRPTEGIARYRQAIQLEPDNAVWLAELGALLLDRRAEGDLAEARGLIDRAYALDPQSIAARLCRAELLTLDNRPAEAAALYRTVAADLPPESDLRRTCELRARSLAP